VSIARGAHGDAFLSYVREDSDAVDRLQRELETADIAIDQLRQRHPGVSWLIPVRFDDCGIPDWDIGGGRTLSSIQQVDLFGTKVTQNAARLIAVVQNILGPRTP
jgi:hypothetical protein